MPGACETAKQQGLLVPTACPKARRHCLTLLSEALRKVALPGACETAKQQGLLVPTACPKARRHCLTLLSEALRKVALEAAGCHLCRAHAKQRNSRALRDGTACLQGNGPQCLTSLSEALTRSSSGSCRLPPLPGACETAKQQGPEGRTGPPGNGPHCLTSLSEALQENLAVWKLPTAHLCRAHAKQRNSRALLVPTACLQGHGAHCLTLLSEALQENLAVWKLPRLPPLPGACETAKQQGPEGRTGPPGNGPQCLTVRAF